jgi:hypothetical protein
MYRARAREQSCCGVEDVTFLSDKEVVVCARVSWDSRAR